MQAHEIKPDLIVRGSIFPEPVKIITSTPVGDSVKLIGEGLESSRVYSPNLTKKQLEELYIINSVLPGDFALVDYII